MSMVKILGGDATPEDKGQDEVLLSNDQSAPPMIMDEDADQNPDL